MLIQTHDLVKLYKEKRAVAGVSISVSQGEIVGLLDRMVPARQLHFI